MNPRRTLVPLVVLMLTAFGTTGTLAAPASGDVADHATVADAHTQPVADEPILDLLDALGGAETEDVRQQDCCAAICMLVACMVCCVEPLVAQCSCELGLPVCSCGVRAA